MSRKNARKHETMQLPGQLSLWSGLSRKEEWSELCARQASLQHRYDWESEDWWRDYDAFSADLADHLSRWSE